MSMVGLGSERRTYKKIKSVFEKYPDKFRHANSPDII
jgi:hypothetical protein